MSDPFEPPSDVEISCRSCDDGMEIADCDNCSGTGMVQQYMASVANGNDYNGWTGAQEPDVYPSVCDVCDGTGRPECGDCQGSQLEYVSRREADELAREFFE